MKSRSQFITLLKGETFIFLYGSTAKQTQEITLKANQRAILRCPTLGLSLALVRKGYGPKRATVTKNIPVNTRIVVKP